MTGKVWLVGAGPGDPGLLTVRAAEVLQTADIVVYDYLVEPGLLDCAPTAERLYMGKSGAHKGADARQADIISLLIEHATQGRAVVRLKGGDPFVFGRGGEEAEALRAAGVPYEVIPGVTSAIAVPAYAGIPVTHRDHNTALAVVTGHEDPRQPDARTPWAALAAFVAAGGTLVILMGVKNLARNLKFLADEGVSDELPVALIRWGTRPDQVAVHGTLGDIVERAVGVGPPAVCVVGPVAALGPTLSWFRPGPLRGARVWVPRPRDRAAALCAALRDAGARPFAVPLIETASLADPLRHWAGQPQSPGHVLAFTSAAGVDAFLDAWFDRADLRALAGFQFAAVGPATTAALAARGLRADIVQREGGGASLAAAVIAAGAATVTAFVAREYRPELGEGLVAAGVAFEAIACYETRPVRLRPDLRDSLARVGVDAVVLTSPSTVDAYLDQVAQEPGLTGAIVAIGATTAAAARAHGAMVAATARSPAVPDLVAAVCEAMGVD